MQTDNEGLFFEAHTASFIFLSKDENVSILGETTAPNKKLDTLSKGSLTPRPTLRTHLRCARQAIAERVRELLGISEVLWSRSIADPPRDIEGLFLEMKSRTGVKTDELTPQQLLEDISH